MSRFLISVGPAVEDIVVIVSCLIDDCLAFGSRIVAFDSEMQVQKDFNWLFWERWIWSVMFLVVSSFSFKQWLLSSIYLSV